MLSKIYGAFEQRGFINYETLLETAHELKLSNPRGAALTVLGCQRSVLRALVILEERAQGNEPIMHMIDGLRRYAAGLWNQLHPKNPASALTLDDISRWRTMEQPVFVEEEKLGELADLFVNFSTLVVAMQLVVDRLMPESEGRDFAQVMTPVLFVAYLTDADIVPPKFITEPVFAGRGLVSEEMVEHMLEELHRFPN